MQRSVWAVALAGGVVGGVVVDSLFGTLPPHAQATRTVAAVSTTVCTVPLFWLALQAGLRAATDVPGRTVASCTVLGWLNTPLSLSLVAMVLVTAHDHEPPRDMVEGSMPLVAGLVFGLVLGLPLGVAYGLVSAPLAMQLRRLRDRPTHDGPARASCAVGTTLMVGALLALLGSGAASLESRVACVGLGLLGAVAAVYGRRQRFLSRQALAALVENQSGEVHLAGLPGASLERVPRASLDPAVVAALCPLAEDVGAAPQHVLVRWLGERAEDGTEGPYRDGPRRVPWALVD